MCGQESAQALSDHTKGSLKDETNSAGKDHTNHKRVSALKTLLSTCVLQEQTSPAVERVSSVTQQEACMDMAQSVLSHLESRARR